MARFRRSKGRRSRGRISRKSSSGGNNSNILDSLLNTLTFGFFDVHKCDAEDNTWYCKFSRFFGAIIKVIFLLIFFYIIFYVIHIIFFKRNTLSGGKMKLKRK